MANTILIVDDHAGFRTFARRLLEGGGFRVLEAGGAEDALVRAEAEEPDLVLLDIQLPDGDGFDVAARLASRASAAVVVLTSSRDAADYGDRLATAPAAGFLPKAELTAASLRTFLRHAG